MCEKTLENNSKLETARLEILNPNKRVISLDCEPFSSRPDEYIEAVVKGTGLEEYLKPPVSKIFGAWTWDFTKVPDDIRVASAEIVETRIKNLHANGKIRGARYFTA